jgi:hypothetical protein
MLKRFETNGHTPPAKPLALVDTTVVEQIARTAALTVLDRVQAIERQLDDREAFGEREAARLLGLSPHVLRDLRRRGEIRACRGPGKRIMYTREILRQYLLDHQIDPSAE